MYTPISAKQFRQNMTQVLDEVETQGRSYTIIYRSRPKVNLVPVSTPNKSQEAKTSKTDSSDKDFRKLMAKNLGNTSNIYKVQPGEEKDVLRERLRQKYGL